jgi:outer membrane receptor for ferrienterochelin and colicins
MCNLNYNIQIYGLNAFLRGTYRGRYGFKDKNNSNVLDQDNEYALIIRFGILLLQRNLSTIFRYRQVAIIFFDLRKPMYLPSNPGRTFFAILIYNFSSN